ncbi:hypothetical protein KQ941_20120 [Paenibacillus xylanexedens]|uniref:hypothetical protein n=1 Tax=Paenibacillus xylanexedens TaxID=528191 RepID=UPI001F349356|nr:hypothetical protein [Paenibacillus xylanexedens]MCF7756745.1 hypothetical protein [Paenibacillus xylanexedens]
MKRIIIGLFGILVISFVLLLGVRIIGFPIPIVIEHSETPAENELKYHKEGDSKTKIIWWGD